MTTPYDPYGAASAGVAQTNYCKQIPANALGLNNATLTTCLHVFSTGQGGNVLGYSGNPGAGNLICSLSPVPTVDTFGNTIPSGLLVNGGSIQGASLTGASIDSTTVLAGTQVQNASVLQPVISGGTANSLVHVLTNGNGQVLGYTTATNSSTFSTSGQYLWTATTTGHIRVQVWAGGAGGGGGTLTVGGESGGGGEYAEEPSYSVVAGQVYSIQVGQGGQGGGTGYNGTDGQESFFQPVAAGIAVTANGGKAGVNGNGGYGGSGSSNTIHFSGGNGAARSGQTGGQGGGGSASPAGQGNFGSQSTSSTGGAGGTALSGGGAGGAGGNNQNSGSDATAPGGGGGGNGAAPSASTVLTKTYKSQSAYSYWGQDATNGNAGMLRTQNGPMYQGVTTTGDNGGNQFAYFLLPYAEIQRDLNGMTVKQVNLTIHCISSYYSNGVYLYLVYSPVTSFGNTAPDQSSDVYTMNFLVPRGSVTTYNISGGYHAIGPLLQNGGCTSIKMGPPGPEGKLNFTGTFDSGENGTTPYLTVYYHPNGSSGDLFAGNGAAGQVIITESTPGAVNLNLAISSVSASDNLGNSFSSGFTAGFSPGTNVGSTAVTLTNGSGSTTATLSNSSLSLAQGSAPSPGAIVAALYSNSNSDIAYVSGNDSSSYTTGHVVKFSSSATNINSTSPIQVNNLSFNVGPQSYLVRGYLRYQAAASGTTQPMSFQLNGTATLSLMRIFTNAAVNVGGTTVNPGAMTSLGSDPSIITGNLVNNGIAFWQFEGVATFSSSGTFNCYARCVTSGSDESFSVQTYSYMALFPI